MRGPLILTSSGALRKAIDLAGVDYWDDVWRHRTLPPPIDPEGRTPKHYVHKKYHDYFRLVFRDYETRGKQMLEIGCGNSSYLPYFSRQFGFEVSGIDYSEIGCNTSRRVLERERVHGEIYLADFFDPPDFLLGRFDVAVSFGVVEHFPDTAKCIRACSSFVRPGGILITLIPNLAGLNGSLQKLLARSIYDVHVPLTHRDLVSAHEKAGIKVERCDHLLTVCFSALNIESWGRTIARKCVAGAGVLLSRSVWLAEGVLPFLKPNAWTSPYICCIARVPRA
jgi:2-polyprenyl-3-methyl-5-hydroxy-6-metoxy-1,4-benzoquinol methylase